MQTEIKHVANELCEITNTFLENITISQRADLPLFLGFTAKACYVKYDTLEEKITDISIVMIDKNGFAIVADPIDGYVRGYIANEICTSVRMRESTAKTLHAFIQVGWKKRLSIDCLISLNGDGRYIAADLFA